MRSEVLVKEVVDFQCEIPNQHNQSILLKLFKVGNRKDVFGEYSLPAGETTGVFPKVIRVSYEGYFECVASMQNNTEINATVSQTHYLRVIEPVQGAKIFHPGPKELFEGNNVELQCNVTAGNHLSYKWLLNERIISPSPFHHIIGNNLIIYRATSEDSGSYRCVATNTINETKIFISNSSEVVITVKDLVSKPDIVFTVLKEDYQNYSAIITCQSERGALPITFSLYNNTELVSNVTTQERHATFKVPVVMDQDHGSLQCHANNGDQTAYSQLLPLKVVPVDGPVTIDSKYDMAENYAVIGLRFYCKAAKGSHPRFQWFLNETLLNTQGSFYYVFDRLPAESILLLSVGRSSTGTYHCEVSDSFDNTTAVSSKRRYLNKEVLNHLPILVVAVVFGCFTFLILLVSFCCLFGAMFRKKQSGEKYLLNVEMNTAVPLDGDEEISISSEDHNELTAPTDGDFYQESDASVDDWPELEEERKTLEDEEV
ncbi:Fc receptor-like protein 5 [Nematolebias whitei]|uniref:Fc receptor-like protein 5 n=1 Tax=Nematolebias whitei TaxID=451745 RepID=UPI00189B9B37|nr:Fc receptor-like protein 5 [Nematolebias whitei]